MGAKLKRLTSSFLLVTFILLSAYHCLATSSGGLDKKSPASSPIVRGGKIRIIKRDGVKVRGELFQVDQNVLVLHRKTEVDVRVDIAEIREIKIIRSRAAIARPLLSSVFLAMVGTSVGYLVTSGKEDPKERLKAGAVGGAAGLSVAVIWAIANAANTRDIRIQVEGMSEAQISETLEKLRRYARAR